jgi:hypothetical protein
VISGVRDGLVDSDAVGSGSLTMVFGVSDSPLPNHHQPITTMAAITTSQSQIGRRRFRRLLMYARRLPDLAD